MGLAIKELIDAQEIGFDELKNKVLAVDSFNLLYQFLTTIRGPDGSPLTDSSGNITSHLVGLFSRTTNLMEKNIRLCFVFDGIGPELKFRERERRKNLKLEAEKKYEQAKSEQDVDGMKKFAGRTARLTKEMVEEAKSLIEALGLPVIQAPSEGEAQAAYMARKGDCYAAVSQDFDSLIHGAPRLVRNLSIAQKKKVQNKLNYVTVRPEMIILSDNLKKLEIELDQLIALSMLVGTDYNIGGIKGIGPKKAYVLVKKHATNFDSLFNEAKWNEYFNYPWTDVFNVIKKIPVTDDYSLKFKSVDCQKIKELLVKKHEFNHERVEYSLEKLKSEKVNQKGLGDFF